MINLCIVVALVCEFAATGSPAVRLELIVPSSESPVQHATNTLTGWVTTDDGTAPPPAPLYVTPVPASGAEKLPGGVRPQLLKTDGSFVFDSIEGHYLFRVTGLPENWMLRSVTLNDRDITDTPVDVPNGTPSVNDLQIVLSRTGAGVTGDVVDAHGAPLPDCTIVIFAEDTTKWAPGSRFVKPVHPDQEGHFLVGGLPSGTYLIVARDSVADGQWMDPAFLQSLTADAARLQLREGTTQEISLKFEMP